jgi:8-oxo-dGTP pyrophosphatase MutT (NUDIX family)
MLPVRPGREPRCALSTTQSMVHSRAMGDGKSRTSPPSVKLFRLSHVREQRECEQVAAVCYRVRGDDVEFLLVRTGSGHWTFPKGGVEPGLTHAQAASLEAFEEAGVHGRIQEASFTRYIRRKKRNSGNSAQIEIGVSAYLCEVLRLSSPQETGRNPSWFSSEKTKRRLSEDRARDFAAELVRVVDSAIVRIQRLRGRRSAAADVLQKV